MKTFSKNFLDSLNTAQLFEIKHCLEEMIKEIKACKRLVANTGGTDIMEMAVENAELKMENIRLKLQLEKFLQADEKHPLDKISLN